MSLTHPGLSRPSVVGFIVTDYDKVWAAMDGDVGSYAACAISRIAPEEGLKPIAGYMAALLVGTFIVATAPWISTGLLK